MRRLQKECGSADSISRASCARDVQHPQLSESSLRLLKSPECLVVFKIVSLCMSQHAVGKIQRVEERGDTCTEARQPRSVCG